MIAQWLWSRIAELSRDDASRRASLVVAALPAALLFLIAFGAFRWTGQFPAVVAVLLIVAWLGLVAWGRQTALKQQMLRVEAQRLRSAYHGEIAERIQSWASRW